MLNVNDGGGLYTTTGLIDTVIVEINEIECKGIENHAHVMSCIDKLSSIKKAVNELHEALEKLQNGREEFICDTENEPR